MIVVRHEITTEKIYLVDFGSARTTFAPVDIEVGHLWDPAAGESEGACVNT